MSADWHAQNNAYLSAALGWLRLTLLRHASFAASPPPPAPSQVKAATVTPTPAQHRARWFRRGTGRAPEQPVDLGNTSETVPKAGRRAIEQHSRVVTEEEIAAAKGEMDAAAEIDPPPALLELAARLGLSTFERDVLLVCVALELDPSVGTLCAIAQHDDRLIYPTFALALAMFEDAAWDALAPGRPLRYARLIEISQAPGQALTASALSADERVVNYVKGLNYLDDRVDPLLTRVAPPAGELPASQQAAVEDVLRGWSQAAALRETAAVQLLGPDGASKRAIAAAVSARVGRELYRLPLELLPTEPAALETFARLWWRESQLLPIVLYLDAGELDGAIGEPAAPPPIGRFLSMSGGLFLLATREARREAGPVGFGVDVCRPTPAEQRGVWTDALGSGTEAVAGELAGQFDFDVATIRSIAQATEPPAEGADDKQRLTALWDACVATTRPRMDALAQRVESAAKWEQLVLPEEELTLLHRIADQVRARTTVYGDWGFADRDDLGLGISALLSGPPGTGKTLCARVLATELRLNLYRIDLSAVVSKYIGETEKNLRRLFDSAEQGAAVLFFDEADALFGKRSEVKDTHDRYANIEVNYLLQRMESYRGVALLATNMRSALDTAFLRRLRFVVNFPFPEAAERRAIWAGVFPPRTPIEGLDYDRLAKLAATGGMIRNIALNAAFRAARARDAGHHAARARRRSRSSSASSSFRSSSVTSSGSRRSRSPHEHRGAHRTGHARRVHLRQCRPRRALTRARARPARADRGRRDTAGSPCKAGDAEPPRRFGQVAGCARAGRHWKRHGECRLHKLPGSLRDGMASAFPNSPRLARGGLVLLDPDTGRLLRVISLQYNPDTLTRTLVPQGIGAEPGDRLEALRLKGPPQETIRLEAEIDAADSLGEPTASAANVTVATVGLLADLVGARGADHSAKRTATGRRHPGEAGDDRDRTGRGTAAVFVWGQKRVAPVRADRIQRYRAGVRHVASPDPRKGHACRCVC